MAVKWGLSILDWRAHAVDEHAWHPTGVYKAACSHTLLMVTPLLTDPAGKPCDACAALQFRQALGGDPP